MPIIRKPDQMQTNRYGDGCTETILADRHVLGEKVMVTQRWSLDPHTRGPETMNGDYEEMLYVISGSGTAQVGGERYELQPECMLWIERGDTYHLSSGPDGLEVLHYCAPDN